jgi:ATP-dependent Lon protease
MEDVPASAREQIRFVWLDRVSDAIDAALTPGDAEAEQEDKRYTS